MRVGLATTQFAPDPPSGPPSETPTNLRSLAFLPI